MKQVFLYAFWGGLAAILILASFMLMKLFFYGNKNPKLLTVKASLGERSFSAEIAKTVGERMLGLSGRDGIGEEEGMLFLFDSRGSYGFWMKDMKFPIDIIWIGGNEIVGISENVLPEPGKKSWQLKIYYPPQPVDKVFEIAAGAAARLGIKIGDKFAY